jgi:hypothetical protein
MIKQFYEKALPTQGVYCVAGIDRNKVIIQRFAETLDQLVKQVEVFKKKNLNVYVALATFDGYSRKAEDAVALKSFFIDLDVGKAKNSYSSKAEALTALHVFIAEEELPPPVLLDSGNGVHVYWVFDEAVPVAEWVPYAKKFKGRCVDRGLIIDPTVTADAARILRCPDTFNQSAEPPIPTFVMDTELIEYSFDSFKEYLDKAYPDNNSEESSEVSFKDILAQAPKGLDEDTLALLKRDNFENSFSDLAVKSLNGEGCAQIKYILENAENLEEPIWYAGLSIARRCEDWEEAIHVMSEDYKGYSRSETIKKAEQSITEATGPHRCEKFDDLNSNVCNGCPYKGRISTPLQLAERLRTAKPAAAKPEEEKTTEDAIGSKPYSEKVPVIPDFPDFLHPFVRGVNGGIYYQPAPKVDKKGKKTQDDPVLLTYTDLFPVKRLYSKNDGECLLMANITPKDPYMEFLLPMKDTYSMESFKKIMASNRVFAPAFALQHLMNYIIKWGQYLLNTIPAEQMRMQMGWTEEKDCFVIGNKEITQSGVERHSPSSPFVRGISKLLKPTGTYEAWRKAANLMDRPEFNMHSFGMLCGFGSPLMNYTSTSGVSVSYTGESGGAKTGALYAALSIFGDPKELSVFDATDNGMIGRYLGMHNLMLGCDEVTNKDSKALSQLIHRISHGKAKIRMQASVNAEREYEMFASMIGFFTCNEPIYDKLKEDKANPGGEMARLIEFMIPKSPLFSNNSNVGVEVFDTFRKNYGHAGPLFIKELFKVGDAKREDVMGAWKTRFMAKFGQDSTYRFYENLISSAFGGGQIAKEGGIITLDLDRVFHHVVGEMIKIRDKTVKFSVTDYKALIGEFINQYHSGLLVLNDGKVVVEPRNALVGRVEVHNQISYVSKTAFKAFLAEKHISSNEFEHALTGLNILVECNKQRLSTGWRAGMSTPPIAVYGFKSEIPQELLNNASE